jgi:rhodanese-related sulfurtransferase
MDDQVRYYQAKLQYEIDPWDLNEALGRGDKVHLVDTRSPEAYERSHIPGAICDRLDSCLNVKRLYRTGAAPQLPLQGGGAT